MFLATLKAGHCRRLAEDSGTAAVTFGAVEPYSPQTACRAERLGIVTRVPLSVSKCLFLNSLSVRVIVSRVEPIHSAICSWVNAILICAASAVGVSLEDQFRNNRATFSFTLVDRPTVRNCSQHGRIAYSAVW